MKTYKNIKKSTKIGLILSIVFIILGIGCTIFNLIPTSEPPALPEGGAMEQGPGLSAQISVPGWVRSCVALVLYLLTAFYAIIGYKKPHGNLLKYLFIAFAVSIILNTSMESAGPIVTPCFCLAALSIVYVSGRFQKINQNRILLVIAGVFLLPQLLFPLFSGSFLINTFFNGITPLILLFALGFAYTARYEEHKAAGLADKADAKTN